MQTTIAVMIIIYLGGSEEFAKKAIRPSVRRHTKLLGTLQVTIVCEHDAAGAARRTHINHTRDARCVLTMMMMMLMMVEYCPSKLDLVIVDRIFACRCRCVVHHLLYF